MQVCPRCHTPWSPWGYCLNDGTLREKGLLVGNRYELERPIGKGGMGIVFAARHSLLGKPVAVKVLHADLLTDAVQVGRFLREAQLCSQLDHENIVDITDFGRDENGSLFLVMELLSGTTLASVLREDKRLSPDRALPVLRQICRALGAAHQAGVVHRDLTPRNVMLTEVSGRKDMVKLLDFGISRLAGGQDRVTQTGVPLGTVAYMPPEQLRGEAVQDHHVDIYALGVIIHEVLAGRLPFLSTSDAALVAEKLVGPTVDLGQTDFGRSYQALGRLVSECLAVEPERRPASAAEVEQRLQGSGATGDVTESLTGMRAGSYRLVSPIGAGGLGSVWLGEHPVIGSRVAVKVLLPEVSESPDAVRRFITEAQAVNRMNSPNIVKIFDFGKLADERDYAVMELLDGETLGTRIERVGALDVQECRAVAIGIARALRVAHEAGVIHRDLKPDNVFLHREADATVVKVLDFGIAKLLSSEGLSIHQTKVGFGLGTPLYAAPEQMEGAHNVGPAADIYSFGVVLHEMLTGTPPFSGTLADVVLAKARGQIPPLPASAPPDLAGLTRAMLAPAPRDRPASMGEVLAALEASGSAQIVGHPNPAGSRSGARVTRIGTPSAPHAPEPVSDPVVDLVPKRRRLYVAAAVGLAAILGVVLVFTRSTATSEAPGRVVAVGAALDAGADLRSRPGDLQQPPARDAGLPDSPWRRVVVVGSVPAGARVLLGGRPVGRTPVTLRLDPRLEEVELVLEKAGFRRYHHCLSSRASGRLVLRLRRETQWHDPFPKSRDKPPRPPAASRPPRKAKPILADPFEQE
jgi:serine/threonine protein kinase